MYTLCLMSASMSTVCTVCTLSTIDTSGRLCTLCMTITLCTPCILCTIFTHSTIFTHYGLCTLGPMGTLCTLFHLLTIGTINETLLILLPTFTIGNTCTLLLWWCSEDLGRKGPCSGVQCDGDGEVGRRIPYRDVRRWSMISCCEHRTQLGLSVALKWLRYVLEEHKVSTTPKRSAIRVNVRCGALYCKGKLDAFHNTIRTRPPWPTNCVL